MTRAPTALLAPRQLLLEHLGPHGLVPVAVGIVGDPAHRGGYHCGADRVVSGDYSVVESPRDRSGLSDDAAALDIGQFRVARGGQVYDLRHFSRWLVGECAKDAADTRDIREVIYSPDGKSVKRWDRLGRRSSGDRSHLTHTHISYHRDAIKAGRDQSPLFRRYLASIGLLDTPGGIKMFCKEGDTGEHVQALQVALNYAGFEAGAEDGKYGKGTSAAVLRMRKSVGTKVTSGDVYDAHAHVQLQIALARKFGPGEPGQPAPPAEVDYARLVDELLARLASAPARG